MPKLALPKNVKKKQLMILLSVVGGLVLIVLFGLWMSDPNKGKPDPRDVARREAQKEDRRYDIGLDAITAEESWIARSESDIHSLRRSNRDLETQLKLLQQQVESLKNEQSNTNQLSSPSGLPPSSQSSLPPPPPPPVVRQEAPRTRDELASQALPPSPSAARAQGQEGQAPTIQAISLSNGSGSEGGRRNAASYLPAGSFATVVLLSGVDAPTGGQAASNPTPVLLRLMDHGQLPNYFNSNIQDCHITAAAAGEISSERAHIRLEKLSCVLANGDVVEVNIQGYVAGEDGKAGMRGRVVTKQGSLLARSLLAGLASGTGQAVNQQYQQTATSALGTVQSIDPNRVAEAGLASGFSNAMEKLADFYMARANEMYPVIEIDANRIGEVVLLAGIELGIDIIGNTRQGAQ